MNFLPKNKPRSLSSTEISIKCLLVGDLKTKKNELLFSYRNESKDSDKVKYVPWVVDNYCKRLQIKNQTILLTVWDTTGQEELDQLRKLSYGGINMVLILFNINEKDSFDNAFNKWYIEIQKQSNSTAVVFVGNHNKDEEEKENLLVQNECKAILKKQNISLMECENFSPDIIDKMMSDTLEMYVKNNKFSLMKRSSCNLI